MNIEELIFSVVYLFDEHFAGTGDCNWEKTTEPVKRDNSFEYRFAENSKQTPDSEECLPLTSPALEMGFVLIDLSKVGLFSIA